MNSDDLPTRVLRKAKRYWMQYALRNAKPEGMNERLELLYKVGDPWNLANERETARFEATNRIIRERFPGTRSILELGSGEGHQTKRLLEVAPTVVGVEVSATAVERARANVPNATFAVGDVRKRAWGATPERFDLAVACEVLYYLPDAEFPAALSAMEEYARNVLVTFFAPTAKRFAPVLPDHAERTWFHYGGVTWLAAWWKSPR